MAKDDRPKDLMGYEALQQAALRGVVREALVRASSPRGLPGEHHFYISFRTGAPGVVGPADLMGKYPEEMTIVLQNQYWDLKPAESGFAVTLQFGGQPENSHHPLFGSHAILRSERPISVAVRAGGRADRRGQPLLAAKPRAVEGGEPKIVSLDQFRKK